MDFSISRSLVHKVWLPDFAEGLQGKFPSDLMLPRIWHMKEVHLGAQLSVFQISFIFIAEADWKQRGLAVMHLKSQEVLTESIFRLWNQIFRPPLPKRPAIKPWPFINYSTQPKFIFPDSFGPVFRKLTLVLEFFNQNNSVPGRPIEGKAAFLLNCTEIWFRSGKTDVEFSEKLLMLESKWCVKVPFILKYKKLKNRVRGRSYPNSFVTEN